MDKTEDARHPRRWNETAVPDRVAQRAISNVDVDESGCWISRYSVASHGYAQIGWQDKDERYVVLAHRAAWVAVNDQVPVGVTLDHECRVKACVNPAHLRLMTNYENARRNAPGEFPEGQCRNGHPDSERVKMTRQTKSGARRYGLVCGPCIAASRRRWAESNPDKAREAQKRYNEKRRDK